MAERRILEFSLPAGVKLLNANQRHHPMARAKLTAAIRAAALDSVLAQLGRSEPLTEPLMERAYILGRLHPATRRRCDAANWYPSWKAAIDAAVQAGVLPDDSNEYVVGPDMRIGPVVKGGRLHLTVVEVSEGEHRALSSGRFWEPGVALSR